MYYRYLLALCLSAAALPALAHNPLPSQDWCHDGRPVRLGEFNFSAHTLKTFRTCTIGRRGPSASPICATLPMPNTDDDLICPPAECGEFDDDYHVAKIAAHNYCEALSNYTLAPGAGPYGDTNRPVIPLFDDEPASFKSPTHHTDYRLDEGIKGVCMLCMRADRNNPTQ